MHNRHCNPLTESAGAEVKAIHRRRARGAWDAGSECPAAAGQLTKYGRKPGGVWGVWAGRRFVVRTRHRLWRSSKAVGVQCHLAKGGTIVMTKTEYHSVREDLEKMRSQLEYAGRDRNLLAAEATPDDLDRTQQANDQDFTVSSIQRNTRQWHAVKAAIRRVDAGTYGICADCEEAISPRRLAAVPWASRCISCQEAADRGEVTAHMETEESDQWAA